MILQLNHAWIENQIIPDGKTHFNNGDKAPVSKVSERSEVPFLLPRRLPFSPSSSDLGSSGA